MKNKLSPPNGNTDTLNERLALAFYASWRYNPVFLAATGIGFLAIFLLAQFGVLGNPAPQLVYIGSVTLLAAVAALPALSFAQQGKGIVATFYGSAIAVTLATLLTLLWQGILPIAILLTLATPLVAFRNGLPRRHLVLLALMLTVGFAIMLLVNTNPPVDRLQNSSSAGIASIVFLSASALLLVTITGILQNRRFRSIQNLLLTSFIMIVIIPILMTVILSGVGAYANSQIQTFNTLHAISTLKQNQIENILLDFRRDADDLLADDRFTTNVREALTASSAGPQVQESFKRQTRFRMVDVLGAEEEAYNEIMVLNSVGEVAISTLPEREGASFESHPFFLQGKQQFYAGFADEAAFGTDNMIIASPISSDEGQTVIGVLVLRSNAAAIKSIMESTPGFVEAETYLIDANYAPVTRTRVPVESIRTRAATEAIENNVMDGQGVYMNYAGQQVLGYYEWFPSLQLAVIAEVPLSFVITNSVRALAGSFLLALFVVAIAVAAVVISARTIADPIQTLAQTAESFAAGDLSTRAVVERDDEIGALAKAYNQMATQLQETIGELEQRVFERTRDLEGQTLRLRVAAEITRDAASARDLQELLEQAGELIVNRFAFYHAGIFLLDNNREYAVLVASPTQAGKQMLANGHKLRVGEVGLVGRVAATGEPLIALDTGTSEVYFNNPFLPNTRSEMALPLKVESTVIGVLDVQSEQPDAFNEDDIAIMQVMADQLATAIERTRLLQAVESNLQALESAYGTFTRENWKRLTNGAATGSLGYRFDNVRLERISQLPDLASEALTRGVVVSSNGSSPSAQRQKAVAIPVKLRGQTIGVVSLKLKDDYDSNTISIIEAAADRLAAAMESARLYEEARLRADREQSISRVTTAISASAGYEQILQTTVREIGEILGDAEVAIQILDEPALGQRGGQGER